MNNAISIWIRNLKIFHRFWKTKYHYTVDSSASSEPESFEFKETRPDGVDVYTCGTENGFTTEFYFRDGLEVGFWTRDAGFGFSIFGKLSATQVMAARAVTKTLCFTY